MYRPIISDEAARDMLTRQEFYSLKGAAFRADKTDSKSEQMLAAERGHITPTVQSQSPQLFGKRIFGTSAAERTILFSHGTGTGKCHGQDTPILMFDLTLQMVQDIKIGDFVAGDDGKPRRVCGLSTGRGQLFEVCCNMESFTCTANHVLCLLDTTKKEIVEMSLADYILCGEARQKSLLLYKSQPATFDSQTVCERRDTIASLDALTRSLSVGNKQHADKFAQFARATGYESTVYKSGDAWCVLTDRFCGIITQIKCLGESTYYGFEVDGNHRYLLGNFVVTHNSYTGLGISATFTDEYKLIYKATIDRQPEGSINHTWVNRNTPSVFVIGWTATMRAFMRDLIKYPEFGFVTPDEAAELRHKETVAISGLPEHIKAARDYKNMLKHRTQTKSKGGFYQFYGYIEFVNRLFSGKPLVEVEREVLNRIKQGEKISLEQAVTDYIKDGSIKVNSEFVGQFHGSLLIVDEFHNLYNSVIKNNRGVAIYYLMSIVPDLFMVGLTATPANSPTEVLEYLSLLRIEPLNKEDFFVGRKLLPGAIEKIEELGRGYISFLQDTNLKYFPSQIMMGETITVEAGPNDTISSGPIPYLKFVPCAMSKYHQEIYEKYVTTKSESDISELDDDVDDYAEILAGRVAIPADGLSIYDMVFPTGNFRSKETRTAIVALSPSERESLGIDFKKIGNVTTYTGSFLRAENVGVYSTKLAQLWKNIHDGIVATKGVAKDAKKTLVYHNAVRMSGVLLLQEFLCINGFIGWAEQPNRHTLCFHCGCKMMDHPEDIREGRTPNADFASAGKLPADVAPHTFVPARLINIHSDIDKATMDHMLTSYSSAANLYGEVAGVIIGSKKIKEGFEIPHTRKLIIVAFPSNISILLQIFGRIIRKGSHSMLGPDKRNVEIYILVSTINLDYPHTNKISPELYRYAEKLQDYKIIQQIEKVQNENAIDAPILYDVNMTDDIRKRDKESLGNLLFEPRIKLPEVSAPATITYFGYKWAEEDLKIMIWCIKRLFAMQPAWTYEELWATVRNPPFGLETNPALFLETVFITAMSFLSEGAKDVAMWKSYGLDQTMVTSKDVMIRGKAYRVVKTGNFYCLCPITVSVSQRIGHKIYSARVDVDAETFLRPIPAPKTQLVSINKYLQTGELNNLYVALRDKVIDKFAAGKWQVTQLLVDYSREFQARFIEDAIIETLNDGPHSKFYRQVLDYASSFGITIKKGEVWKYKDVAKQFGPDMAALDPDHYIAYCYVVSVKIYDMGTRKWLDINKIAINRKIPYKANSICVGILEPKDDKIVFKIRESTKEEYVEKDRRLVINGATCDTRSKDHLLELASKLGISSAMSESAHSIKSICAQIRDNLMSREQHERRKRSLVKYLYGWWD